MGAPNNIIAIARQQTVFAILEATKGVLEYPEATTPILALAGYVDLNQNPSFTDSEEIVNSRDLINQFQDMTPAGSFSLPMYASPAGAAGSAPMGDVVFKSLFGGASTTPATSVIYTLAMEKPSFSLWAKRGHTLYFCSGAVGQTLKVDAQNKGGVKIDVGGAFFKMGWAGRDAVAVAAASGATSLVVYDAKKYSIGAPLYNATQNKHGYKVTAVNTATNTLTLDTALLEAWDLDDVVQGYLPAGVAVGEPLESRKTTISFGGVTRRLTSLSLNYDDTVKMLDDEMNPDGYVEDYVENARKVTATASAHFRQNDLELFTDGYEGNEQAVVMTFGTDAGNKLRITMPRCKLQIPKTTVSAPVIDWSVDMTALGTNGEDSISVAWL